ncbi:MAG: F0F1 ATP synthase subunit delta [Candidatus Omnitrophica bacterium]|nr:F0F1 ATP synthase subunit delta [Candidatus Omnitrophota bacterium]
MLVNLLIVQIITFIGIVLLLRFLFTRHLKSALARLNTLHEENLAKEEELNEELRRAKEQSDVLIAQSREEADLIIAEANKDAQRIRMNMEEQARKQAEKIICDSRIDSEKIQKNALKDIQGQSIELALKMISELLTETDKVALQYELANGIIEEISRLPKEQFSVSGGEVNVTSSFPLLERQSNEIKNILSDKSGSPVNLNQKLDPGIIGGLIVEMGGMVIDGTLKNKLQRIVQGFK